MREQTEHLPIVYYCMNCGATHDEDDLEISYQFTNTRRCCSCQSDKIKLVK